MSYAGPPRRKQKSKTDPPKSEFAEDHSVDVTNRLFKIRNTEPM